MNNQPELLLPAGSLEIVKTAIDHGADAVYIGYKQFSARAKAQNLSLEEIYSAIDYAHERNAKIFCALNILLFNEELEDCIKSIAYLVEHNIDAFIVQDFGIATMILSNFPETEVHVSTQMAIMNLSGVQAVEALGFDRVVLARETSERAMRRIRANSDIDLEVFVQGALCVSYSGLCYMSSLQGDRSGNRGQCAQPCRTYYKLYENNGKSNTLVAENYLLSPKDMNLLKDVPKLMDIPVQSFKIEGRMKQPEYVALMTDVYRKHIDKIKKHEKISQQEFDQDIENMSVIFSREGYSSSYFNGVPGKSMMSYHSPKNTGIPLGEIIKINKTEVTVKLYTSLTNGDGIALYNLNLQPIWGGYLDSISDSKGRVGKYFAKNDIVKIQHGIQKESKINDVVFCYKTYDKDLSKSLLKKKTMPAFKNEEKGILYLYVNLAYNQPMSISALLTREEATDDKENSIHYNWESDFVIEQSRNGKSSVDVVEKGLNKISSNGYKLGALEISGPDDFFVPMSIITKAKNKIVEHFDQILKNESLENNELEAFHITAEEHIEDCLSDLDAIPPQIKIEHEPVISVQVRTYEQAVEAIKAGAEELNVLLFSTHNNDGMSVEQILSLSNQISVICSLPPLMKEEEEETYFTSLCEQLFAGGIRNFMVSNLGHVKLLEDIGVEYYIGDYQLNLTNDLTGSALTQIGFSRQTLSIEIDYARMQEMSSIGNFPLELIIYGRLPAMNTRYCPMGSIVGEREIDRACARPCMKKNYYLEKEDKHYDLISDQFCNVYILNDKVYSLLPHLSKIYDLCLDYWRIAGAFMSVKEIGAVVGETVALKKQLLLHEKKKVAVPEFKNSTAGHFFKGVR